MTEIHARLMELRATSYESFAISWNWMKVRVPFIMSGAVTRDGATG